jgi:hypothetical protein
LSIHKHIQFLLAQNMFKAPLRPAWVITSHNWPHSLHTRVLEWNGPRKGKTVGKGSEKEEKGDMSKKAKAG